MRINKKYPAIVISIFVATSAFAYTFKDAISSISPGGNGLKSGLQWVELMHKANSQRKYGSSAQAFVKFLDEVVQDFDFGQLYDSKFMSGRDSGFHTVSLQGIAHSDHYKVDLIKGSYASVSMANLGNIGSEWGLKRIEKSIVEDTSFQGRVKIKAQLKQFSDITLLTFLEGLQKVVAAENLKSINPPPSNIYANIKGPGRKLLDEYHNTFPHFSERVAKYTKLKSLVTLETSGGKSYSKFNMIGSLNMGPLEDDFEEVHDFFEDLEGMANVTINIADTQGRLLSVFNLDSTKKQAIWKVYVYDGKVLPFSYKGKPYFDQAFSLKDLKKKGFFVSITAKFNIMGLKINMGKIVIRGDYKRAATKSTLFVKASRIPKPQISGRVYHVIPTWMIDVSIPGNIDELAGKFTTVLEKGNDKKGTRLYASINRSNPSSNILTANGSTEFIDNRFVKFGVKIWNKRFRPKKETFDEFEKFGGLISGDLIKDLKRLSGS